MKHVGTRSRRVARVIVWAAIDETVKVSEDVASYMVKHIII
jgi:hypothetical protein